MLDLMRQPGGSQLIEHAPSLDALEPLDAVILMLLATQGLGTVSTTQQLARQVAGLRAVSRNQPGDDWLSRCVRATLVTYRVRSGWHLHGLERSIHRLEAIAAIEADSIGQLSLADPWRAATTEVLGALPARYRIHLQGANNWGADDYEPASLLTEMPRGASAQG